MKASTLSILVILAAILGVVGWKLSSSKKQQWAEHSDKVGQRIFPSLPVNDITKITIRTINDEVMLQKSGDDSGWTVSSLAGYPADFSKVAKLANQIRELEPVNLIRIGKADLGRLELSDPGEKLSTGTVVELLDKSEKPLAKVVLGKKHMSSSENPSPYGQWPNGRFVYLPSSGDVFLVTETFSAVTDKSSDWLNKDFIQAGTLKSLSASKEGNEIWSMGRELTRDPMSLTGTLADNEKEITDKLRTVGNALSSLRFDRVAPLSEKAANGLDASTHVLTAMTFDGISYTLTMGKKADDGSLPILVDMQIPEKKKTEEPEASEDGTAPETEAGSAEPDAETEKLLAQKELYSKWIYFIPSWSANNLLTERSDLVEVEEPEKDAPVEGTEKPPAPEAVPAD